MHPLEEYLTDLRNIRSYGGVEETSYYTPLANLLNEIGKGLKPKVRCIINPRNAGAGIPDGGLFTPDQKSEDMIGGQLPARGAIEVKGFAEDLSKTVESEQVLRYLQRYGQVLVTNYWDFRLLARGEGGNPETLESFRLADNDKDFTGMLAHPRKAAEHRGGEFVEYLKRVMLRPAELTDPKDVAWFLASYARVALIRVERAELPALDAVRTALEEALGLEFEGEKGEHFFRSTLVQTIFYGVFSAWILWRKEHPRGNGEPFEWKMATWYLHVPMIRSLFEQIAMPNRLEGLGLVEVLDWTGAALNRVDPSAFFERFEEQHAVQYFYEPFLEAFDPDLRKELGVWYTPPEIVEYMVERVDTVLREELHIADGLADPQVYVLDPACGTGAYLVQVLKRIEKTLRHEKGRGASVGGDLKQAATERVFGFELLPAPFVISHLQLGLLLRNLGAPLADDRERAGVYLTNALTGWEPPTEEAKKRLQQLQLSYPELKEERDAAQRIKYQVPVLVVIGNPPYNGFAGVAVDEERDLSNAYRTTKRSPTPQGQGLNDLYVRFFRMAERRIVEKTRRGIVCLISNYSWLDSLSCPGMRERYLEEFDRIWIDNLNGDKYETGKLTPWGEPDPSVFSTEFNREGIQVGTAIALLVRKDRHAPARSVQFRNLWGKAKREQLRQDAKRAETSPYDLLQPQLELGLPFAPLRASSDYLRWPLLADLSPVSYPGVKTSRDDVVVDIDRERLITRMEQYFDASISDEDIGRLIPRAMEKVADFEPLSTRHTLLKRGFLPECVVRHYYRPFDIRWLYWEPETDLLDRKRPDYFRQISTHNLWLGAAQKYRHDFDSPVVTSLLCSLHVVERGANMFPIYVSDESKGTLFDTGEDEVSKPNLSTEAQEYLARVDTDASAIFHHIVSVLYTPSYRTDNSGALRQDWPRIPLPNSSEAVLMSAALGRRIAALLDTENAVTGVTSGTIRRELRGIGTVSRVDGGQLNPASDLEVTVGWGHHGQGGVTMPGKGRPAARPYTQQEKAAIEEGARAFGLSADQAFAHLGDTTLDVYLNDVAYWENVPAKVWNYTIGGYQVMKKWLSYRESDLLGRPLTLDEVHEVENMARRIAAILLLEPELDANYQRIKASTYPWPGNKD